MHILGISAYYHDSAASIINDEKIIAAVSEERFTRIKHDDNFPINSINFCLDEAKLKIEDIDYIVFYEKPFLKFERILETYLAFAPKGFNNFRASLPVWIKHKLFLKNTILSELKKYFGKKILFNKKLKFSEHHLSHAASAFFPSPFNKALILTMDGVGEWSSTSVAIGNGSDIKMIKDIYFPHSLGLLYSAFTYYLGFKVNSGEYKLMGLAPYGKPKYVKQIKDNLIKIFPDGSFKLNMKYFDYCTNLKMTNNLFDKIFNLEPRESETNLTQKHMDIAASIQKVTEDVLILMLKKLSKEYGSKNLCLAGGVALNCVANGLLIKEKLFENVWIQPASGDAGGSLGAAYAIKYLMLKKPRNLSTGDLMQGSYLGPKFEKNVIQQTLTKIGAVFKELDKSLLIQNVANHLAEGKAVGWMNGRMEFGPRSLGARSILADPRSEKMQSQLNLKVKFRESFRPFAPSIIREDLNEWFNLDCDSPYMLLVADVNKSKCLKMTEIEKSLFGIDKLNIKKSMIPAVTHVDYSARIQTVHKNTNKDYYKLLSEFKKITNCPILVNTSFNVRGEPIVCSPEDAFKCFMGTDLDILVIENFILFKDDQDKKLYENYREKYQLD